QVASVWTTSATGARARCHTQGIVRQVESVDVIGGDPGFPPSLERAHVIDLIGPRTAPAMSHARNHEEADPVVLLLTHFCENTVVVINGVAGRNRGVVPAVIKDQLSTAGFKCGEVRIDRIDDRADLFINN